jgi:hypothetical protein
VRRSTRMDERSSVAAGPSPSWMQVIGDTIKLSRDRRRQARLQRHQDRRRFRLWVPVLGGLVILGAGMLVKAMSGSAGFVPDAASVPAPTSSIQQHDEPTDSVRRSPLESSRAIPSRTASLSRAAAGAEIAGRTDIDISPSAATRLREGSVDGRVLVVLASLATADLVTSVEIPPNGSGGSEGVADLELGVVDVDRVLDWLDDQRRLHPDRMEVRRAGSVTYLEFRYDTPEPPGLFPP